MRALILLSACFGVALAGTNPPAVVSPGLGNPLHASWKMDTSLTDDFNQGGSSPNAFKWTRLFHNDDCLKGNEDNGECTIEWYGMQPAVYQKENSLVQDGMLELQLKVHEGSDDIFVEANANSDEECGCEFRKFDAGIVKSRRLFRGGVQCFGVDLSQMDTSSTFSFWSQSATEEVSHSFFKEANGDIKILAEAHYFVDGTTQSEASQEEVFPTQSTDRVDVCIEWTIDDVITAYPEGSSDAITTLSGWRNAAPADNVEGGYVALREEHAVMMDINFKDDTDVDSLSSDYINTAKVDYVVTYESNCFDYMSTVVPAAPAGQLKGDKRGPVADTNEPNMCQNAPMVNFCHSHDFPDETKSTLNSIRGLCHNTHPGQADVMDIIDYNQKKNVDFCGLINWDNGCEGLNSYKPNGFTNGRGSQGLCIWDPTWDGSCKNKPGVTRTNAVAKLKYSDCITDSSNIIMYQWCFGTCGLRTDINEQIIGDASPYARQFATFCNYHRSGSDWKDSCEQFGVEGGTSNIKEDGTYSWATSFASCRGTNDIDVAHSDGASQRRRNFCSYGFKSAADAPYAVPVKKEDNTTEMMTGVPGMYCYSTDAVDIQPFRFNILGRDACENRRLGVFMCTTKKSDNDTRFRCFKNANLNTKTFTMGVEVNGECQPAN